MIWGNPWAWLGLLALAVPVVIHLLGRRSARIRKFPTLRFIGASRLMATRWTRPSDLALLAVRLGVIAAAVAALAQPLLLLTASRQGDRRRSVARAIIVDTSASMTRLDAVDLARAAARRFAGEATTNVIIQTAAPAGALTGAAGWLEIQRGGREIVVISDFQTGSIDRGDLAAIPNDIGIRLVRIDEAPAAGPIEIATRQDGAAVAARVLPESLRTQVEWRLQDGGAAGSRGQDGVVMLAGPNERARADAAQRAAMAVTASVPASHGHPVAIVHREYELREQHMRDAQPLNAGWQGDIVARLRGDSMLAAAASAAEVDAVRIAPADSPATGSPLVVVARAATGVPVAVAGRVTRDGVDWLLIFSQADAGSLASAALIAATMRASSVAPAVEELEPTAIPETMLASLRRPAASAPASMITDDDASDGRWFWILVLVLFGVETWMRRVRREASEPTADRERAA